MAQGLTFHSFKMSSVSPSHNVVGIHKRKAMERLWFYLLTGLSTLSLHEVWGRSLPPRLSQKGQVVTLPLWTQLLQLPQKSMAREEGRQSFMVEVKGNVGEGIVFALGGNEGQTWKWVLLDRKL